MFKLMGKEINANLCAQTTILIWTYVKCMTVLTEHSEESDQNGRLNR